MASIVSIQPLSKHKALFPKLVLRTVVNKKNVSFTLRRKFVPSLSKDNVKEQQNCLMFINIEKMLRVVVRFVTRALRDSFLNIQRFCLEISRQE